MENMFKPALSQMAQAQKNPSHCMSVCFTIITLVLYHYGYENCTQSSGGLFELQDIFLEATFTSTCARTHVYFNIRTYVQYYFNFKIEKTQVSYKLPNVYIKPWQIKKIISIIKYVNMKENINKANEKGNPLIGTFISSI